MEGSDDLAEGLEQKTASALHIAASNGDTKLVEVLLNDGVSVNTIDEKNNTALHLSARNGHTVVLTMLLNAGATPDMNNHFQGTALHLAAENGYSAAVRALLNAGASVNMMNEFQNTALHLSAREGNVAVVHELIDAGASVDMQDSNQWTALHLAAANGHTAVVKALLDAGASVDSKGLDGITRFDLILAKYDSFPLTKAELDSFAEEFLIFHAGIPDISGFTPLMAASFYGHLAVVKLLVRRGASLSSSNGEGWTAILYDEMSHHAAIRDYLISKGRRPAWLSFITGRI